MSPPEFSIICRSHGGPATIVYWFAEEGMEQDIESQLIVDTSQNSTYENRLLFRRRFSGKCTCTIQNNIQDYFPTASNSVLQIVKIIGMRIIIVYVSFFKVYTLCS